MTRPVRTMLSAMLILALRISIPLSAAPVVATAEQVTPEEVARVAMALAEYHRDRFPAALTQIRVVSRSPGPVNDVVTNAGISPELQVLFHEQNQRITDADCIWLEGTLQGLASEEVQRLAASPEPESRHLYLEGCSLWMAVPYIMSDNEAMVYAGHVCGPLYGATDVFLLRRAHGRWQVSEVVTLIIS